MLVLGYLRILASALTCGTVIYSLRGTPPEPAAQFPGGRYFLHEQVGGKKSPVIPLLVAGEQDWSRAGINMQRNKQEACLPVCLCTFPA